MVFEHWILLFAVVLGLVHVGAASFAFKAQVGNAYSVGPRDEDRPRMGMAGRLHRAQTNFLETFPLFLACIFLVHVTGAYGPLSRWGAGLYLAGRMAYLPLYAAGIPWLRTFSWNIASLGLAVTGAAAIVKGL